MEHRIIKILKLLAVLFAGVLGLQSCYYDNVEDLYPQPLPCDTTNITFSGTVWPIINNNCTGCHSGSAPSGNISLTNYSKISAAANNGKLLGVIRHEQGYPPMPKGGGKLSNCNITQIENWVNNGTPGN